MRWIVNVEQDSCQVGLNWAKDYLKDYDTSELAWVKIDYGSEKYTGLYGECVFPTLAIPFYKIYLHIPGPWPDKVHVRQKPIKQKANGDYPALPKGAKIVRSFNRNGVKGLGLVKWESINNMNEALVWTAGHEFYHFLKFTKQIKGTNSEIRADEEGTKRLEEFRKTCQVKEMAVECSQRETE